MLAQTFPFSIYYEVIDNCAVVVAVLDNRSNPSKIIKRLLIKSAVFIIATDVSAISNPAKYLESEQISIPTKLTRESVVSLLQQRIASLDIQKAKADVLPFINDARELELWSPKFFNSVTSNIEVV